MISVEKKGLFKAYIDWMARRPVLNLACLLGYYLAVVLPHKAFGNFLNTVVFKGISRDQYNDYVAIIVVALLLIYTIIFLRNGQKQSYRRWLWITMLTNVALAIAALNFLFVINIEAIHFIQYALFAILAFPLFKNYHQLLIIGVIAGAIDEAYQYFYLAPRDTSYYDFNDVITNLIGLVFGSLLLRSTGIENTRNYPRWKSPAFIASILLLSVVLLAWLTNVLSIYPSTSSRFQLVRTFPTGFWSKVHPNVTYHVVLPLEGSIITGGLLYLFGGLLNKQ